MQDLTAGRIDYLCDSPSTSKPQIDGGFVKAIATTGEQRWYSITPPEYRSPEYFRKFVADEIVRWSGPIEASGVTVE